MRVLVIGGTRFMGYQLTWRLVAAGHEVTLLNRGTHADPFGARVSRLRADRTQKEFFTALAGREFDAAVDFAAFQRADAEGVVKALEGRVGHYVLISTGQVYLVRADPPVPAREEDYDGPLMAEAPPGHRDRGDWEYGMGKRACEDVLAAAWSERRFPSTRLRIPIVNGERDHLRRLESYVWRILDNGPLLVPDGGGFAASPFSTRWKSFLDPGRAQRELAFVHPPLRVYLDKTVASLLAYMPAEPPGSYEQRPREIEFAKGRQDRQ